MKKTILSLILILLSQPGFADLYKWVDDEGTVHMTDALSQVPPKYRDQVDRRSLQSAGEPGIQPTVRVSGNNVSRLRHVEVSYLAFEGRSRRIIIPVTFNDSVKANLLLDTGSPGLMITPSLADRLGLIDGQETSLRIMTGGIGGSTPAILAVVDSVQVGDARSEFLPATITTMPSAQFEGLVGMDFMANYKVSIDIEKSILTFDELPPQSDRPGGHDEAWWRSNFERFESLRDEWTRYLERADSESLASSEKEKRLKIAKEQFAAADDLCRRLERYARDNAVPTTWRR
jgi:hypothetical protein